MSGLGITGIASFCFHDYVQSSYFTDISRTPDKESWSWVDGNNIKKKKADIFTGL
jgi:hypothetical protein